MWGNIEPNRPDVKKIELSKIDFYLPKLERKLGAWTYYNFPSLNKGIVGFRL